MAATVPAIFEKFSAEPLTWNPLVALMDEGNQILSIVIAAIKTTRSTHSA